MTRRTLFFFLSSLLLLIGTNNVYSESYENYKLTFNTQRSVGLANYSSSYQHNFAPANWGHVVGSYEGSYSTNYITYTYDSSEGVGGSGALGVGSQFVTNGDSQDENVMDILVTPLVNGRITLDVKEKTKGWSDKGDPSVTLYKMTKNADGTFTRGDTIKVGDVTIGSSYSTISTTLTEPTYVGIRGSLVWMDNFTAATAEIETKSTSLYLRTVDDKNKGVYDANSDNTVTFKFDANLINDGLTDFKSGDENYSLSLLASYDGDTIATFPITQDIAAGETGKFSVEQNISVDALPKTSFSAYVQENVTGSKASLASISIVPYKPIISITETNNTTDVSSYDFGYTREARSHHFLVRNSGAKAMKITGVVVPEGFESSLTGTATVAPHDTLGITLTLANAIAGDKEGDLIINGEDEITDTLHLKGIVAGADQWLVDFEDCNSNKSSVFPAGIVTESSNWQISNYPSNSLNLKNNNYCAYNSSASAQSKMISPLLEVADGESLSFDAAKSGGYNASPKLDIYYSADRKNWTLVHSISTNGDGRDPQTQFSTEQVGTSSWNAKYAFRRFTVSGIPAGRWYVAFEGSSVYVDNILGYKQVQVAHDLMITSSKIESTGMVNYSQTAKATLHNANTKAEAAGSYTAKFYLGGEVVAEAETPAIAPGDEHEFSFDVTPHKAGTFPAYIEFAFDTLKVTTDTVVMTVSDEQVSNYLQIGTPSGSGSSTAAPVKPSSGHSQGFILLTKEDLAGIAKGTVIKSLKLRGAASTSYTAHKGSSVTLTNMKFYVLNSDSTSMPTINSSFELTSFVDTTQAKPVYNGSYNIVEAGEFTGTRITGAADIIEINFAEPFVYNGNSIVIVGQHDASSYLNRFLLEADANKRNAAVRTGYSTGSYGSWYSTWGDTNPVASPVVYLGVDATPTTLSGVVTDTTTNQPLANVPVTITSGNVIYSDTTDATGSYNMPVLQTRLEYTINVEREGYDPYVDTVSVSDGSKVRNIALKTATGLYIVKSNILSNGEVNSRINATATIKDVVSTAIVSDQYTAKFFFDGNEVDAAQTQDLTSGATADYSFGFTPHATGTFPAYIQFEYNGNVYTTDTVQVTVGAETYNSSVVVNDSTSITESSYYDGTAPFSTHSNYSNSDMVYTKERLGIQAGTVIKNIAFKGRYTYYSYQTGDSLSVQAFIENTDATNAVSATEFTPADTTKMVKIYDGKIKFPSDNDTLLNIPVADGFVYTGSNIRIFVKAFANSANITNGFVTDNTVTDQTWIMDYDNSSYSQSSAAWKQLKAQPVMYLEVVPTKVLSGKVVARKGLTPIAGATVSLKSGDVLYTATTNSTGDYEIVVGKYSNTYDAIFVAKGYKADTISNVTLAGDLILNDTLLTVNTLSGTVNGVNKKQTAALAEATISVVDANNDVVATATSDDEGKFSVELLDADGSYSVIASKDKYTNDTIAVAMPKDTAVTATLVRIITIAGQVMATDDGVEENAVEGATVTLVDASGNVVATTTTDASGNYHFDIPGADGSYTVVVSNEGYNNDSTKINISGDDVNVPTITIQNKNITGIQTISVNGGTISGDVYTVNGQFVGRDINPKQLRRGIYIVNGRKFAVK